MQNVTEAEEHLRVIRSLMEKATIYRAVSAPTALAGGVAAMLVILPPVVATFDQWMGHASFHARWVLALMVTLLINGLLIVREARRRGDPVVSAGMRTAFQALLPPMLSGGVFFLFLTADYTAILLTVFYGLALLATAHFAPRSIMWLGWAFLATGLAVFVLDSYFQRPAGLTPDVMMATTFGGFHFLYAACTWPRRAPAVALSGAP